jgi:hypothetical protein
MRGLRILLLLFFLVLALGLWLQRLVEPEAVAARLGQLLEQATGLSLRLETAPEVELLPGIGLGLGPGELRDRDGHPVVRFERIIGRLSWSRLLKRPLELQMVKMRGLDIDLPALARHQAPLSTEPVSPPRLPPLRLPIEVQDLRLRDGSGSALLHLDRLAAPALHEDRPWRLQAEGHVLDDPALRFTLAATVTPTPRPDGIDGEEAILSLQLKPWLGLALQGELRWRADSLSFAVAGRAELDARLAEALASAAESGSLRSEGRIGGDAAGAEAVLSDPTGRELARLQWTPGRPDEAPLRLSLPRVALDPVRLEGIELELPPREP